MIKTIRFSGNNIELLQTALSIRNKVFVEEQGVPISIEYDNFDQNSNHYLIIYEGNPAATSRWRIVEEKIKLERFAVLKEFRGKNLGYHLLRETLFDTIIYRKPIYLHAQKSVIEFYKKYGFTKEGAEFSEAGIAHFLMSYSGKPL